MAGEIPYRLTRLALQDLAEIRARVADDHSSPVADRLLDELDQDLLRLSAYPGMGRARPEFTELPLFFWPFYSWQVVYDPAATPLEIVRVVSARRDLTGLF